MSQPLLIQPPVSGDPSRRSAVPTGMRAAMAEGVQNSRRRRRSGWFGTVVGVGVLLIVLGVWNAIDG
jgi:hypothetical protein